MPEKAKEDDSCYDLFANFVAFKKAAKEKVKEGKKIKGNNVVFCSKFNEQLTYPTLEDINNPESSQYVNLAKNNSMPTRDIIMILIDNIEEIHIGIHGRLLIQTGVHIQPQKGFASSVRPRSGLATDGVSIHLGTIDNGYIGDIGLVTNTTSSPLIVKHHSKLGQLFFEQIINVILESVDELDETDRGSTGFGASGI